MRLHHHFRRLVIVFMAVLAVEGITTSWEEAKTTLAGKTCAIVSNSAELLNHEHGAAIDANDVVVRLNLPPIGGRLKNIKKHAGSKTDLVFTGYPPLIGLPGKPTWARAQGYHPKQTYDGMNETFAFMVDAYCASDKVRVVQSTKIEHSS